MADQPHQRFKLFHGPDVQAVEDAMNTWSDTCRPHIKRTQLAACSATEFNQAGIVVLVSYVDPGEEPLRK